MKIEAYSIYDNQSETYAPPIFVGKKGVAIRSFISECSNPDSMLFKYPADYQLFHIGQFDQETGMFTPMTKPTMVASAMDYTQE